MAHVRLIPKSSISVLDPADSIFLWIVFMKKFTKEKPRIVVRERFMAAVIYLLTYCDRQASNLGLTVAHYMVASTGIFEVTQFAHGGRFLVEESWWPCRKSRASLRRKLIKAHRPKNQHWLFAVSSDSSERKSRESGNDAPNPTITFGGEVLSAHLARNNAWKGNRWQLAQGLNWPESKLSRILNGAVACKFNDFVAIAEESATDPKEREEIVSKLLAEAYSLEIKALSVERPSMGRYLLGFFSKNFAERMASDEAIRQESESQQSERGQ